MKRHRVRLRPKAWRRRGRLWILGLCALGAFWLIGTTARWGLPRPRFLARIEGWPLLRPARVETLSVSGVPASLEPELRAALDWRPGQPWWPLAHRRKARRLKEERPYLGEVRLRRFWLSRAAQLEATLRVPVARVKGASGRYLDDEGGIFFAPEGLYPQPLPELDLTGEPRSGSLGPLARLLMAASAPGALPRPLSRLGPAGDGAGWEGELADGTRLLWGDLRWTDEKLSRLREVLLDARERFGRVLSADLRSFEDGKIFIRP